MKEGGVGIRSYFSLALCLITAFFVPVITSFLHLIGVISFKDTLVAVTGRSLVKKELGIRNIPNPPLHFNPCCS